MNRLKELLGALLMCAASGAAHAEIFDLSVGDNSFRAALYGPLSRIAERSDGQYDIGVVMRPKREDDLLIAHVGALLTGDTGMRNFELAAGLGVRGVYIGRDRDSGGAIAPGGQLEARFPGYERVGFSIYGYYGPEVLSFGEFDEYYELGLGVDYQVLKTASLYAGYRNINLKIEDGPKVTADNGLHLGLRLEF